MELNADLKAAISGSDSSKIIASLLVELNGFLDEKTVEQITGLSRTERYRMRVAGTFPEMKTIKGKIKGWRVKDIKDWLDEID